MGKLIDLTGRKFTRLFVIKRVENSSAGKIRWLCRCDCGKELAVQAGNLLNGFSKSCGCYKRDQQTTHGMAQTREYRIWAGILSRCNSPTSTEYQYYGGRGIRVCKRWNKFENFFEDMGSRPKGLELDRIDNNGNYEPGNCRWTTRAEQNRNKRGNVVVHFRGMRMVQKDFAKLCGVRDVAIKYWRDRSKSVEWIYKHFLNLRAERL